MEPVTGTFIPLEAMRVAAPCRADWNAMRGDDQARFCESCAKHVYNLSGMTRAEAESLIRSHERDIAAGDFCIGLKRRADGTVITDECPVGLRRARNASRYAGRVVLAPVRWSFSVVAMLLAPLLLVAGTMWAKSPNRPSCAPVAGAVQQWWVTHVYFGRKVQTVFGMGNNALTTGDMLNLPAIDMLSSEETARSPRVPSESVPSPGASQPVGP